MKQLFEMIETNDYKINIDIVTLKNKKKTFVSLKYLSFQNEFHLNLPW